MLSKNLEEIVEVSGYAAALELCRGFGGRTVRVPTTMMETHPLALTMGYAPACALSQRFGGEDLPVPAERTALMDLRNQRIVAAYQEREASISELALEFGLTRKRITEVLDGAGVQRRSLMA